MPPIQKLYKPASPGPTDQKKETIKASKYKLAEVSASVGCFKCIYVFIPVNPKIVRMCFLPQYNLARPIGVLNLLAGGSVSKKYRSSSV